MEQTTLQTLGDKDLYDFLVNCPKTFRENERIRKFQLKNGDYIHCVLWNYHFYITGTDIVKILIWRFQHAGRPIGALKKFEEGIFSDLRNLKPGIDATLEGPRTEFLEFLYKNGCIRTQKKQKVFYWYSVPHDELFCDALERDLRRDTSLYTYNRYVQDSQRGQMPELGVERGDIQAMLSGMPSRKAPLRPEPVVSGSFNVKDALFGSSEPQVLLGRDEFGMNGKSGFFGAHEPSSGKGLLYDGEVGGHSMSMMAHGVEHTKIEEVLGDDKLYQAKTQPERKFSFDDFDLGQFEFLKERCHEHFSKSNGNCEQKLFESSKKDKNRGSMERIGEVSFIGSKDRK